MYRLPDPTAEARSETGTCVREKYVNFLSYIGSALRVMVHEVSIKEVTIYFFEMELGLDMCQPISMVEVLGGTG